jgi:hypothetical protein
LGKRSKVRLRRPSPCIDFHPPPKLDFLHPFSSLFHKLGSRIPVAADGNWEAGANPALPRNC